MRRLPAILIALGLLTACGSATSEELASLAAKGYYEALLEGDYDAFLAGRVGADSLPDSYRQQLRDAYKQFVAQQDAAHHGINAVRIADAKTDTALHYTNVFLVLCFGDSTNEQVAVPMMEEHGVWKMR